MVRTASVTTSAMARCLPCCRPPRDRRRFIGRAISKGRTSHPAFEGLQSATQVFWVGLVKSRSQHICVPTRLNAILDRGSRKLAFDVRDLAVGKLGEAF